MIPQSILTKRLSITIEAMKLLGACLLASCALLAQTVEGTVTNASSSAPIAGVIVRIQRSGKPEKEAATDSQGAYRMDGLQPGDYTIEFSKPGFRQHGRWEPTRQRFQIAAASVTVRLDASLVPLAKLSGRVLDSGRRPVSHANVQLLAAGSFSGQIETSDDNGDFLFTNIDPGTYVLSARAPNDARAPPAEGDQKLGWVRTWYPSVTDSAGAARIAIAAGADLDGENIELRALPAHSLRGQVLDAHGEPASHVSVKVASTDELIVKEAERETFTAKDGSFEFPNLYDGTWRLKAAAQSEGAAVLATARQEIAGRDIDRLELRLVPPFTVPGRVVFDAPPGGPQPRPVVVVFAPAGGGDHVPQGAANPDGSLVVANVTSDSYRITPIGAGEPYYLASIQVGSREVMGEEIEFMPGSPPITITYKSDGGSVQGTVEDCNGASVTLAPQQANLQWLQLIRGAACDANGRFRIANIRPGEYYAYAFDRELGMLERYRLTDPSLANQAVRVTVRPGEASSITLKVTSLSPY
jgi:carboxypeptidase family protein